MTDGEDLARHLTHDQAKAAAHDVGESSVLLMENDALQVQYYEPVGEDRQTQHAGDKVYFVADGYGTLMIGESAHHLAPGDMVFVPAECPHRFVDITVGFGVWMILCGPDRGEAGR